MTNKIFDRNVLFNNLDILRISRSMTKSAFNKLLQISNAYRSDCNSIGAQLLRGIQDNFPGIDEKWLLTPHDLMSYVYPDDLTTKSKRGRKKPAGQKEADDDESFENKMNSIIVKMLIRNNE
jgi:hypothetical protein